MEVKGQKVPPNMAIYLSNPYLCSTLYVLAASCITSSLNGASGSQNHHTAKTARNPITTAIVSAWPMAPRIAREMIAPRIKVKQPRERTSLVRICLMENKNGSLKRSIH